MFFSLQLVFVFFQLRVYPEISAPDFATQKRGSVNNCPVVSLSSASTFPLVAELLNSSMSQQTIQQPFWREFKRLYGR